MPEPQPAADTPRFYQIAKAFYASAFGVDSDVELQKAMVEWRQMDPAERSFIQAHLLYLNIQAQAALWKRMGTVSGLTDEIAELVSVGLEYSLPEQQGEAPAAPAPDAAAPSNPPAAEQVAP